MNSLRTLRPGGVAVHTTEYNVENEGHTLHGGGTVLFRRQDLEPILLAAVRRGYRCSVNWSTGGGSLDAHVDAPPYSSDQHLKLKLGAYVTTSIGMILEKP